MLQLEGTQEILGCSASGPFRMSETARQVARKKIMLYPLDQVRYRLEKDGVIPAHLLDEAISEWRKFMTIILYSPARVGMISPLVDEVWHAFILHTRDYADFCQDVYGKFIHHAPNWPGAPLQAGTGDTFRQMYSSMFGRLPAIWTVHKAGIDCESALPDDDDSCGWTGGGTEDCAPDSECNGQYDDDCSNQ